MKKLIQNHKGGIITDRKSLKKREKDFCREYVYCGNTVFPEMCGIRLLTEKRIKDEIAELEGKLAATRAEALCGYRRIAFGNISDAVKLILESDGDRLDAEKLDLFNVAEIKKPRGGGMEIKFFDRLKALEKIEQLSLSESDKYSVSLYKAIENSAKASAGGNDDDC